MPLNSFILNYGTFEKVRKTHKHTHKRFEMEVNGVKEENAELEESPKLLKAECTDVLMPCTECNLWHATKTRLTQHKKDIHKSCIDATSVSIIKKPDIDSGKDNQIQSTCSRYSNNVDEERLKIDSLIADEYRNCMGLEEASGDNVETDHQACSSERNQCKTNIAIGETQEKSLPCQEQRTVGISPKCTGENSTNIPKRMQQSQVAKGCYKCSKCTGESATFASSKSLQAHHTRCHKQELEHTCRNCGHHFKHNLNRSKSIRTVYTQTGLEHWMCEICCKEAASLADIKQHKLTHHRLTSKVRGLQHRYACALCSKTFPFQSHLAKHKMVHTGEKPYICEHCPKSFRIKSQLHSHMNLHTKQTLYICGECDAHFYQDSTLKHHLKSKHQAWAHKCLYCGKCHVTKRDMLEHERIHTGEKPYICEKCGMTFPRKQNLQHHLKAHRNERLFACDACGKAFFRKATLKEHMRIHSGEKPYQCQHCSKRFTQKSHLGAHLRSHLRKRLEKTQLETRQQTGNNNIPVLIPKGAADEAIADVGKKQGELDDLNLLSAKGELPNTVSFIAEHVCLVKFIE